MSQKADVMCRWGQVQQQQTAGGGGAGRPLRTGQLSWGLEEQSWVSESGRGCSTWQVRLRSPFLSLTQKKALKALKLWMATVG